MRVADDHGDVAALPVGVEVERDPRVVGDMAQLGLAFLAEYQYGSAVPVKPHRPRPGRIVARPIDGREPDDPLFPQTDTDVPTEPRAEAEHGGDLPWCSLWLPINLTFALDMATSFYLNRVKRRPKLENGLSKTSNDISEPQPC